MFMTLINLKMARYAGAVMMAAVLEALSVQNDNLTVPLYMWSVLVIAVI
jgi:dolichol kinase